MKSFCKERLRALNAVYSDSLELSRPYVIAMDDWFPA